MGRFVQRLRARFHAALRGRAARKRAKRLEHADWGGLPAIWRCPHCGAVLMTRSDEAGFLTLSIQEHQRTCPKRAQATP